MSFQPETYKKLMPLVAEADHLNKSRIRGLRLGLGHHSSWEGKSMGCYLERAKAALKIRGPVPLDLVNGHLMEPRVGLFDGSWPIRTQFHVVEALVVAITGHGWQLPETTHRAFFHSWARRINGPVFVSLVDGRGIWASTSWIITATECARHGSFEGECERYSDAR